MVQLIQSEARPSGRRLPQRATYLTIRITGVLLAVLALGHFAITHVLNDVATTTSAFVARRWGSVLWVIWDGLLLSAALLHAGAGLVAVIRDYRTRPPSQRRWFGGLAALVGTVFVIGMSVLVYSAMGAA